MPCIRRTLVTLALVSLLALAVLVIGCGGGGEQPASPSALLVDSSKAVREQKPVRFAFDTEARVDELVPGPNADAQLQQFAGSPTSLGVDGAYSPEAVKAKGSAQFGGQTFTAEALAGPKEAYLKFLNQWYGTKEIGLDQLRQQAEQTSGKSSDQAFNEAMANIERYGKDVFEGNVEEGPEIDGAATWQTEGTFNVDGLARIAQDQGQTVKPEEREALAKLAEGTKVTYVIGQDDKLPRRVIFALDFSPADFAETAGGDTDELKQVERIRASLTVNMTEWGEEVAIDPPPDFQPLEQVLQQVLGGASAGGAGGGLSQPGAGGLTQP